MSAGKKGLGAPEGPQSAWPFEKSWLIVFVQVDDVVECDDIVQRV